MRGQLKPAVLSASDAYSKQRLKLVCFLLHLCMQNLHVCFQPELVVVVEWKEERQ